MGRAARAIWCWFESLVVPSARCRAGLEQAVHDYVGGGAVFATGSGRSALAVCLRAAGVGPSDEVLVSAYTCLAVPTAVIAAGATPVYADINADTLNVDVEGALAAMSPRVRAVVVQHTLGSISPVQAIVDMAHQRGITVIEDCALSLGSHVDGRSIGTCGDAAIFSMELSKTLSCGWGGLLVVNNAELANRVARDYATIQEPRWLETTSDLWQTAISAWCFHPAIFDLVGKYILAAGFRSRVFRSSTPAAEFDGRISPRFVEKMGGPQARLARLQWMDLPRVAAVCEANASYLRDRLRDLRLSMPGMPERRSGPTAPRVSFLVADRPAVVRYFRERGIELGQWFDGPLSPVPTSPLFNYQPDRYPVAQKVANRVVNLPCHSRITPNDLSHIAAVLSGFVRDNPAFETF